MHTTKTCTPQTCILVESESYMSKAIFRLHQPGGFDGYFKSRMLLESIGEAEVPDQIFMKCWNDTSVFLKNYWRKRGTKIYSHLNLRSSDLLDVSCDDSELWYLWKAKVKEEAFDREENVIELIHGVLHDEGLIICHSLISISDRYKGTILQTEDRKLLFLHVCHEYDLLAIGVRKRSMQLLEAFVNASLMEQV